MAFKIKKILTANQLYRAKFSISLAMICIVINVGTSYVYAGKDDYLKYDGDTFLSTETEWYERGRIVYYSHNE